MRILIETVPHHKNRNNQVGDYKYLDDGTLYITVSEVGDYKMEWLVAAHEMIEEMLASNDGVTEEMITAYDEYWEKRIALGLVDKDIEPGFSTAAPYRKHHTIATGLEMTLAAELGVDWLNYEEKLNKLTNESTDYDNH